MSVERFKLSQMRLRTHEAYNRAKERDQQFLGDDPRHLDPWDYRGDRGVDDYSKYLPQFEGKTFVEHISEKNQQGAEVTVLDIGCGQGITLAQLQQRFPAIKTYGISATDMRQDNVPEDLRSFVDQIDYRVGDIHHLRKFFKDERFDIIVSLRTFVHLGDPLSVLKQSYALLKRNGVAFLDEPGIWLEMADAPTLRNIWQADGANPEFDGFLGSTLDLFGANGLTPTRSNVFCSSHLAIRKESDNPHLSMPFVHAFPKTPNFENLQPYDFQPPNTKDTKPVSRQVRRHLERQQRKKDRKHKIR